MPKHNASQIFHELGRHEDIFEIIDLNADDSNAKRNFEMMLRRCEDLSGRVSTFFNFAQKFDIEISRYEDYEEFKNQLLHMERNSPNEKQFFEKIENDITNDEKTINELINSYNSIKEHLDVLRERKAVYTLIYQLIKGPDPLLKESKDKG